MHDHDDPTKEELLEAAPGSVDTDALQFKGMRGTRKLHLSRSEFESAFAKLPPAPLDRGTVDLLVARPTAGGRHLPKEALLTVDGGMPEDRWAQSARRDSRYQLATTRTDVARLIANGQPLELHGDNLFLDLDLSTTNLPIGSTLKMGEATLQVTPQQHNGCKKWVQRFGLDVMQINMDPRYRSDHVRGIYLQVILPGVVRVGDEVVVLQRG